MGQGRQPQTPALVSDLEKLSDKYEFSSLDLHEANGLPYLTCYRGQSLLTPAQQCAEISALEWLADRNTRAELSVGPEAACDDSKEVTVQVGWASNDDAGTLVARCGTMEVVRVDTCADLEEGPTASVCWMVKDIRPR